jgi:hypothetical protein
MKREETKDQLSVTNCRPASYGSNASPEMTSTYLTARTRLTLSTAAHSIASTDTCTFKTHTQVFTAVRAACILFTHNCCRVNPA